MGPVLPERSGIGPIRTDIYGGLVGFVIEDDGNVVMNEDMLVLGFGNLRRGAEKFLKR